MDAESLQLVITIGSLIIGGFGALATAVVAFILGTRRGADRKKAIRLKSKAVKSKGQIETQKVDLAHARIDLDHHNTIIQGYKDLLAQRMSAHDFARQEIHELRNLVNDLRLKHAAEVELLKKQIADEQKEKVELKAEMADLRTRLSAVESNQGPAHTVSSETPTAEVATAA